MAVAPVSPETATGVGESVVVPLPNPPNSLSPQHSMVPPAAIAHVCEAPAVTLLNAAARGVTGFEGSDDALSLPSALMAITVNVYVVPLVSPVTVWVVAVELNWVGVC